MSDYLKPLYRVWYIIDFWTSKVPNKSIQKFDTALFLVCTAVFLGYFNFVYESSFDMSRINGIIIICSVIFLVKTWLMNDKPINESSNDQTVFEIISDDFLAISRFVNMLIALVFAIGFLVVTGEAWMSLICLALMLVRTDSIGPSDDDMQWNIFLDDGAVLFHNKNRTARLRLDNVAQMKVFTAFNQTKKIDFEMNDGQLHQIKYYRRQDEILKHCTNIVPESKIKWFSYT